MVDTQQSCRGEVAAVEDMTDREKLDMILEAYGAWLNDHSDEADGRVLWAVEKVLLAEGGGGRFELANVEATDALYHH